MPLGARAGSIPKAGPGKTAQDPARKDSLRRRLAARSEAGPAEGGVTRWPPMTERNGA